MRKNLLLIILLFAAIVANAAITKSVGWLETAYVCWEPIAEATHYNVYYSGENITDRKIDNQLIRSYGSYMRADIVGLKAGSYTIKVAAVVGGVEQTPEVSPSVNVIAQDRAGFAFSNGRVPGAYKADGTLKDNAVVLYVHNDNKNTISLDVTGATSNPCIGIQTILDGFKKGKDTRPLAVRFIGVVETPSFNYNGDIVVENKNVSNSYITLEGIGDDAVFHGFGVRIKNASNIEIRNTGTMLCSSDEGDNLSLQQGNEYVWVHNNDLFYGKPGKDADQAKGDGALDCKKSNYVTFSYNHFYDTGKSNLLGLSEGTSTPLYVTYHHNWYDHSDSRHPRVRYYNAHVYNNYYDGIAKYGVGSTMGSSLFVEKNVYRHCPNPMMISMQGTDTKNGTDEVNSPTFSKEDGGMIKAYDNEFIAGYSYSFVPYNATTAPIHFDAYVVTDPAEQVPSTVKSKKGSNIHSNFDTNSSIMYNYAAHSTSEVVANVTTYAGRIEGGDFSWTFNNSVDDTSYAVNTALMAAINAYQSKLVYIQGEAAPAPESNHSLSASDDMNQIIEEGCAIEPIVITWGGDATGVTVAGLENTGLVYSINLDNKTITITGTPSVEVVYVVTTTGEGTPISLSGEIIFPSNNSQEVHNFTTDGKVSNFYTITGNLSTSYGTVNYLDLTLTQCLKIESSTNITFTSTKDATLTLVMTAASTKRTYIDGVSYTAVNGIITTTLSAGSHTITKRDTDQLFYISLEYKSTNTNNIEYKGRVIKTTYYTIDGKQTIAPLDNSIIIERNTYENGAIETRKSVYRR